MRVLIDTNVALRLMQPGAEHHAEVQTAVARLVGQRAELVVVPQVLYELWAVASRPQKVNGLGWTTRETRQAVGELLTLCTLWRDTAQILDVWLELVTEHGVSGKPSHDARLAAAGLVHGFDALLTRNTDDFKRFGINVLHPRDVL